MDSALAVGVNWSAIGLDVDAEDVGECMEVAEEQWEWAGVPEGQSFSCGGICRAAMWLMTEVTHWNEIAVNLCVHIIPVL